MGDPLKGIKIEMGGKVRTIKFTFKAMRLAQQRFGGTPLRDIVTKLDVDQVVELAAAGMFHEDRTVSAQQVEVWLEAEPKKFLELSMAVIKAVTEAYQRMAPDEVPETGEAQPPAEPSVPTTTAGPTGG